jgi:hypothetical protein
VGSRAEAGHEAEKGGNGECCKDGEGLGRLEQAGERRVECEEFRDEVRADGEQEGRVRRFFFFSFVSLSFFLFCLFSIYPIDLPHLFSFFPSAPPYPSSTTRELDSLSDLSFFASTTFQTRSQPQRFGNLLCFFLSYLDTSKPLYIHLGPY